MLCSFSVLRRTNAISSGENSAERHQQQRIAPVEEQRQRHQDEKRDEAREMLAEEREPHPPQRIGAGDHHLHQPAGMRAGVIAQRQLQDVLEIVGPHRLAVAMREPVGVQRDDRADDDDEEAESDPGADQRQQHAPVQLPRAALGIRQRIDDAAEQDRFHESGGGQRHTGQRERPAESGLGPEQFEHAHIKPKKFHGEAGTTTLGTRTLSQYRAAATIPPKCWPGDEPSKKSTRERIPLSFDGIPPLRSNLQC